MKKSLAFLLVGVAVVLAVVFASYVVFMQFRPEREMRAMMMTMANLQSVIQDSGFSWTQQEGDERVTTTVYTSGPIEVSEVEEDTFVNHATKFRVVHVSREDRYQDLSGELRVIDGQSSLTYDAPGPDVEGVSFEDETWVEFAQGELPLWGSILPGLNAPIESILSDDLWTTEGLERLRFLLSYADIFHVEYNGLTELIDGANTRIIDGRFDADAIHAFLLDLVRAKEGRQPNEQERIVADMQAKQLARLTLRFWVGFADHHLYRFQAAGGFADTDKTELIPVDVRIEFHGFNEDVQITPPEDGIEFAELFQAAFGALPSASIGLNAGDSMFVNDSSARLPTTYTQASDDPDGDGLPNVLEAFYGTSATIVDTDGDGVNDGDEVTSGRNPRGTGSLFGFGLE